MTRIVQMPTQSHNCQVGWKPLPLPDGHPAGGSGSTHYLVMDGHTDPPGTIRACESCGRTWVGYKQKPGMHGRHTVTTQWRPEGRFERWRRQRREAKAAGRNR